MPKRKRKARDFMGNSIFENDILFGENNIVSIIVDYIIGDELYIRYNDNLCDPRIMSKKYFRKNPF